jgi:hypothetical protein
VVAGSTPRTIRLVGRGGGWHIGLRVYGLLCTKQNVDRRGADADIRRPYHPRFSRCGVRAKMEDIAIFARRRRRRRISLARVLAHHGSSPWACSAGAALGLPRGLPLRRGRYGRRNCSFYVLIITAGSQARKFCHSGASWEDYRLIQLERRERYRGLFRLLDFGRGRGKHPRPSGGLAVEAADTNGSGIGTRSLSASPERISGSIMWLRRATMAMPTILARISAPRKPWMARAAAIRVRPSLEGLVLAPPCMRPLRGWFRCLWESSVPLAPPAVNHAVYRAPPVFGGTTD